MTKSAQHEQQGKKQLICPDFLRYVIEQKELQKSSASHEQVKQLQAEINHARKLLKEIEDE